MKFYILDNGWERIDKSFLVAGANKGTTDNENPDIEWANVPIQCYLIKHEDGYILFDTGCDPNYKKNWRPFIEKQSPYYVTDMQDLENTLGRLDISVDEIKYVIISHLHVDHTGNLYKFRNAKVFVNGNEFRKTLQGYVTGRDLDVHEPTDIEHMIEAHLDWHLVEENEKEIEIVKGIKILNFGSGHSFGMLGMKVELYNTGNLLCVADAVYLKENLYPEIQLPGIIYDSLGFKKTAEYIKEYAINNNCKILYGHDMAQFGKLVKSDDGFYD